MAQDLHDGGLLPAAVAQLAPERLVSWPGIGDGHLQGVHGAGKRGQHRGPGGGGPGDERA